ncbi:MAG: flavin reductase family protein [Desulfurococcales archaeon]|nr:flavin reductase family protein [Desulfurococcales archaeon]
MAYRKISDRELRLLRPLPVFLLFTGSMSNNDLNVMALSWVTPLSKRQRRLGIVVEKGNYSWSLLKKYPWFTIAVPDSSQSDLVKYVGTRSKREIDKILSTDIEVRPWEDDPDIPFPEGFMGILIARVIQEVDFDSSTMFVGHVEGAYADSSVYDDKEGWIIEKKKPVLHLVKHYFTFPCERVSVINTRWGVGIKKPWRGMFESK